jgi:hypothetical protein
VPILESRQPPGFNLRFAASQLCDHPDEFKAPSRSTARNAAAAAAPNWGYEVEPAFPRRRKPRPLTLNEDPNWPFTATATPTQFGWATPEQFAKRRRPQTVSWQDVPVFPVSIVSLTPTQFGFGWDPQFPIRRKPRNFQPDEPTDQWPFTATKTPTQQGFAWEPQFPIRRKRQVLQPDQPAEMWPFTVTAPTVRVPAIAIPPVPERATGSMEAWVVQIARTLNLVLRGKVNAVTSITLTANATSTTLIDDRIGASTYVALVPLTSSSTAIDIAPYVSARTRGSATIAHGSSPATDLEFSVLLDRLTVMRFRYSASIASCSKTMNRIAWAM